MAIKRVATGMKKQTMPMQGRVAKAADLRSAGKDFAKGVATGVLGTAKAIGTVAGAGKAIVQKATGTLPMQKREKVQKAVTKAKDLGVAGGSTGVKKMAKKMRSSY